MFSLFLACLDNDTDQAEVIPGPGLEHQATANPTAASHKGLYSPSGISYPCGQLCSCMLKLLQCDTFFTPHPASCTEPQHHCRVLLWPVWIFFLLCKVGVSSYINVNKQILQHNFIFFCLLSSLPPHPSPDQYHKSSLEQSFPKEALSALNSEVLLRWEQSCWGREFSLLETFTEAVLPWDGRTFFQSLRSATSFSLDIMTVCGLKAVRCYCWSVD